MDADLSAIMGARIRRERIAFRRPQADVAAAADVSQSTISRMELGYGGPAPLDAWRRVAAVLELDMDVMLRPRGAPARDAIQRRCHGLVVDRALIGGWIARTVLDPVEPASDETVLERRRRHEVAIIRVWDAVGSVGAAITDFERRVEQERADRDEGWHVSGAVVIPATGHNRRRLSETGGSMNRAFTARGAAWLVSLGHQVPMPSGFGMFWTDERIERLRPFLPYLDHRCRMRSRRRRPRG